MAKITKTIYLAGPMAGCTDEECNKWRDRVTETLQYQYNFHNPMIRDFRDQEITMEVANEIVDGDLSDIHNSDIVLANYWKTATGTCMEIKHAFDNGKLVLVILPGKEGKRAVSPWIMRHCHQLFQTVDEAILWLIDHR